MARKKRTNNSKDKLKQQQIINKALKAITLPKDDPRALSMSWKPNSQDARIYISMDPRHFTTLHPKESKIYHFLNAKAEFTRFRKKRRKEIKVILQTEIDRLGLPVTILPNKIISKDEILSKNIVFFIPSTYNAQENSGQNKVVMTTIPLGYPDPFKSVMLQQPTQYKVILGSDFTYPSHYTDAKAPLTSIDIYNLLHEVLGHGVLSLKHFIPDSKNPAKEIPPYEPSLTCRESVMAFGLSYCEKPYRMTEVLFPTLYLDPTLPDFAERMQKIDAQWPTNMGILDVYAAEKFKKEIATWVNAPAETSPEIVAIDLTGKVNNLPQQDMQVDTSLIGVATDHSISLNIADSVATLLLLTVLFNVCKSMASCFMMALNAGSHAGVGSRAQNNAKLSAGNKSSSDQQNREELNTTAANYFKL